MTFLGHWVHVIAVFESGPKITLYINGEGTVLSLSGTATDPANQGTLKIGCAGNNTEFFDGLIDEPRIYNRVLTAQEVKALYLNPSGVSTAINPAFDIVNLPAVPSGVAGLFADGSHIGYHDGSIWKAYIQNDGKFYFKGDATHYIQWTGVALQVKGIVSADVLSAINANIGNITAGNIRGTRFQVGGGTNEDIYFEDSAIRMYDGISLNFREIRLKYSTVDFGRFYYRKSSPYISGLEFVAGSYKGIFQIQDDGDLFIGNKGASERWFIFRDHGTFVIPALASAPAGWQGSFAYNETDDRPCFYNVSAWRHWVGVAGW